MRLYIASQKAESQDTIKRYVHYMEKMEKSDTADMKMDRSTSRKPYSTYDKAIKEERAVFRAEAKENMK